MVGRIGVSLKLINNMIRIGKNYQIVSASPQRRDSSAAAR